MLPIGSIIILAVLVLVIGFILGALIATLWSGREKVENKPKAGVVKRSGMAVIAILWRDYATGKLATEIDEKVFKDQNSLSDDQRQRLLIAGREWANWLGLGLQPVINLATETPPAPTGSESSQLPLEPPPPAMPFKVPPPSQPSAPSRRSSTIAKPPAPGARLPVQAEAEKEKKQAPLTIVGQINEILQEIVSADPEEKRTIKLVETPDHGVTVWVGLDQYDDLESVPDAAVKALIRAAVGEWERRTEKK